MTPEHAGTLVWLGVKIMALLGLAIYIVFSAVIVRQEQLMAKVLEASSERVLSLLAWLHLGAAVVVFLLALIIL
jgi:hypothetical protein